MTHNFFDNFLFLLFKTLTGRDVSTCLERNIICHILMSINSLSYNQKFNAN